jgi:cell fate regulator YaaT (PSP1 superfamily)
VIVEAEKGPVIATVKSHVQRRVVPRASLLKVLRVANDHDLLQAQRNEEMEKTAYTFAIQRIRARKLPMKLVRAQWMHDGSKVVFYFSADGRVDFRDLVKDLAHRFRTRIEMHQIGVRDGTRMIGGIGPCGRELCCSTFLEKFAPVSIRMAKDQGMTLNPRKVSGQCGRLMCCLVYEQQLYRRQRKRLPRSGKKVRTPQGAGTIIDVDVINKRLQISLDDGNRKTFDLDDVIVLGKNDGQGDEVAPVAATDYLWDDLSPVSLEDDPGADVEDPEKPRRRRRRSRGSKKSGKQSGGKKSARRKSSRRRGKRSGAKNGQKSGKSGSAKSGDGTKKNAPKPSEDGQKKKSSRRRRRRKKKGDSSGGKGDGGSNDSKS